MTCEGVLELHHTFNLFGAQHPSLYVLICIVLTHRLLTCILPPFRVLTHIYGPVWQLFLTQCEK